MCRLILIILSHISLCFLANYSGPTVNRLPTSCPTLDDWTNVEPMLTSQRRHWPLTQWRWHNVSMLAGRWGPSSPLKGHSPQFSVNVRCGQTDGLRCHLVWREALAQETLCSMGIGDPATPEKKHTAHPPAPNFWPMSIMTKRLDGWIRL